MAGLSQEEFNAVAGEIKAAWDKAPDKEAGFRVIVEYGQKYGYKNVMAALQNRTPKRFTREKTVDEWVDERREEEAGS
jgi:hypothetical protein